jgi:hypothetical protein
MRSAPQQDNAFILQSLAPTASVFGNSKLRPQNAMVATEIEALGRNRLKAVS